MTFYEDTSYASSPTQLQVNNLSNIKLYIHVCILKISSLREALEVTTQERNTLRDLLTKEKDCSALLNTQLIEERTQNEHEKAKVSS